MKRCLMFKMPWAPILLGMWVLVAHLPSQQLPSVTTPYRIEIVLVTLVVAAVYRMIFRKPNHLQSQSLQQRSLHRLMFIFQHTVKCTDFIRAGPRLCL